MSPEHRDGKSDPPEDPQGLPVAVAGPPGGLHALASACGPDSLSPLLLPVQKALCSPAKQNCLLLFTHIHSHTPSCF